MSDPETKTAPTAQGGVPRSEKPLLPVKFISEKGAQYRIYHADGVWGLIGGNEGNIVLNFYVEHQPLPTAVIQEVNRQTGEFTGGGLMQGTSEPGYWIVTRDFQAGIALSPIAATQLLSVLQTYLEKLNANSPAAMKPFSATREQ